MTKVDISIFWIGPLAVICLLVMISGFKSLIQYNNVRKVIEYCKTNEISAFKIHRVYSSTSGLKKEYPSYPSKLSIYVSRDIIFFLSYKRFPFIFRTWDVPFILTLNPNFVKKQFPISRIFRPTSISAAKHTLTIDFVDDLTLKTEVNVQLEFSQDIPANIFDRINTFKSVLTASTSSA